jgi:hypothetical protein
MKIYTPVKAIRRHCLECCCGSSKEVSLCTVKTCPLWGYRRGHRPTLTDLQEVAAATKNPPLGTDLERKTTKGTQP